MEGTPRRDKGKGTRGRERGRFGREEAPMMGVKRSAKKRRSRRTEALLFVAACSLASPFVSYRTEGGIRGPLAGLLTWRSSRDGRVYSPRNTQDARNYGLSIISYASRYLLNIGARLFLRRACVSRREGNGVLRVKDGELDGGSFSASFDTWPNAGIVYCSA